MRRSLDSARVGHTEKVDGFKRLDRLIRAVEEHYQPIADFGAALAHEHDISVAFGGRTVFDDLPSRGHASKSPQMDLFNGE